MLLEPSALIETRHQDRTRAPIRFILVPECAPTEHWSVLHDGQEIGTITHCPTPPFNAVYRCWRNGVQTATPATIIEAMAHFQADRL